MSSVSWSAVRKTAKAGGSIPEDTYNLVLESATAYVSGKGNSGIKYRFKVEDGEWKGATVSHMPVISLENAGMAVRFMEDLATLGVPDNFLTDERDMDEVAALINSQPRRCRAETEVSEYNNVKSNKVKGFTTLLPAIGAGGASFSIAPPPVAPAAPPSFAPPAPPVDQGNLPF